MVKLRLTSQRTSRKRTRDALAEDEIIMGRENAQVIVLFFIILLRACDPLAGFFLGNCSKRERDMRHEKMILLPAINRAWRSHCRCRKEDSAGRRLPAAEEGTYGGGLLP